MQDNQIHELSSLTPPTRETLQEKVYGELRRAIMSGQFVPGRSLPIRLVASTLQTSPMPVREALRQLVTERAIEILPNRSFGVPMLKKQSFREILKIRIELEGLAGALACENRDEELIERLKGIEFEMRRSEVENDSRSLILLNQKFHFDVYNASGSKILLPFIESLWLQAGPYIPFVYANGHDFMMSLNYHEEIIEAIAARDEAAVRSAIAGDLTTAAAIIEENAPFSEP